MNMRSISSVFFAILVCWGSYSQEEESTYKLPSIVPPTPEVAALGKYIETPVNEFTGIPKIQIPIYSIEDGRIKHDINLSYHAQGVKVEEIASRVGMGWTLNAGGMIHRQKRGEPDESRHGFLNTNDLVSEFTEPSTNLYFSLDRGEKDFEPDLFTFSFGGYSGKFFFDQETGEPVMQEVNPLKIEWINSYFIVTTPDGLQYYFGADKEGNSENAKQIKRGEDILDTYTTGKYGSSVDETDVSRYPDYTETWYLKEIYDPISDKSITFDYEEYDLGNLNQRLSSSILLEYRPNAITSVEHSLSEQESKEYVLTRINFENGSVDFIKDTNERLDLSGSYALKQINIYSNSNDLIKSFGLNNTIIRSNKRLIYSNGYDIFRRFYNLEDIQYRLFLSSLKEYFIDQSNNTILTNQYKEHKFEYSTPENLPHRFSTAQDFWGFHNGEHSNANLLPRDFKYVGNKIVEFGVANRQVNRENSQDGVLTKITYPTGGSVEYTYENNKAKKDVNGDQFYESRLNPLYNSYSYEVIDYFFHESSDNVTYNQGSSPYYVMEFSVDNPIKYDEYGNIIPTKVEIDYTNNHNFYFQHPDWNYCTDPDCVDLEEPYWEAYIQVKKNGEWPISHYGSRVYNFQNEAGLYLDASGYNEVYLEPQNEYRIIVNWINETSGNYDPKYHDPVDWNIKLNYIFEEELELGEGNAVLVGGLRIKEIITDDLAGNIDTTTYSYVDESNETTGNFVSLPYHVSNLAYYYYRGVPRIICCPTSIDSDYYKEYVLGVKYTADSSIPLSTTQSSYTGYEKVVKEKRDGENGKTEYNFSFERDVLNMSSIYKPSYSLTNAGFFAVSPVPLENREILRGKLVSKIDYDVAGNIINTVTNLYEYRIHNSIDALNPTLILHNGRGILVQYTGDGSGGLSIHSQLSVWEPFEHVVNRYTLSSRSNLLKEQTITSYDRNGENPVTTSTTFNYENVEFPSLQTGSITTNSKGQIIENKTYYPDDITGTTSLEGGALSSPEYAAIQRLQKDAVEHRIGQPIQQETYVDGELTAIQRTNFSTTNHLTLPSSVEAIYEDGNLEERLTYHSYDAYGNPLEVSKPDGFHTMYIWGYNGQYPIAKIENASYEGISTSASDLIETIKTISNIESTAAQENTLRDLFDEVRGDAYFQNAMITSYTYDPLIGVTSITDPKGDTTYYEYDELQRLEAVKDAEGHLLSTNVYNYKN